jgi:hypothetical protein
MADHADRLTRRSIDSGRSWELGMRSRAAVLRQAISLGLEQLEKIIPMSPDDARSALRAFVAAYRNGEWDGTRTPDSYACEWFNVENATIDEHGDAWAGNSWAKDHELVALAEWLQEQGVLR